CRIPLWERALRAIADKGGSHEVEPLFALPDLLAAEEGDAAGHPEPVGGDHLQLGLVGFALGRVEHGAAGPLVAVGLQSPEDGHALDRLALVLALALVAGRVGPLVGGRALAPLALPGPVGARVHPPTP